MSFEIKKNKLIIVEGEEVLPHNNPENLLIL
jgi:hypothetical protein